MANTLTNLENEILAQRVFEDFVPMLTPLNAFAQSFDNEAASKGDRVKVPFVSSAPAAVPFVPGTGYEKQDQTAEGKDILLNQHNYVGWGLTDKELVDRAQLNMDMFSNQTASSLAQAVLGDIWGLITAANFSNNVVQAEAGFDSDTVATLRGACSALNMPISNRALVLSEGYYTQLLKDPTLKNVNQAGSTETLREGVVSRLHGFDIYESNLIPDNGENLVGFACHPDAIYTAMRYLAPDTNEHGYASAMSFRNEAGMTLGLRAYYDRKLGEDLSFMEALWGKLVGNGNSLVRLASV